jgi:hypothetical protein
MRPTTLGYDPAQHQSDNEATSRRLPNFATTKTEVLMNIIIMILELLLQLRFDVEDLHRSPPAPPANVLVPEGGSGRRPEITSG